MNFKKKLRDFFTLTKRSKGGFTLVELIVVIAILAILAGVAIPVYSGYVKKAEKAGDEQLLAAVNKAFTAAVSAAGDDITTINSATLEVDDDGKVDTDSLTPNKYVEDFELFYQGNENSAFKGYIDLKYVAAKHAFEGVEDEGGESTTMEFNFGGVKVQLNSQDVEIIRGENAFSDRGSAALLNDVGVLNNLLDTGIGADVFTEVGKTEEYTNALASYLGVKREDYDDDDDAFNEAIGTALVNTGNPGTATNNALIMFAASQAAGASQADIDKLFSGTVTSNIEAKNPDGTTDYNKTMANAALAYGMYTAYLQQNGQTAPDPEVDPAHFTKTVTSDAFKNYCGSDKGVADLAAYQAAMRMISDNSTNSEVTGSIMQNGIVGNTDLANLMKEVMGN